jgi:O-acetyl-ADP-ribose deacetylase (regulator of RNase III)
MNNNIIRIHNGNYTGGLKNIEDAIADVFDDDIGMTPESLKAVIDAIREAINDGAKFIVPIETPNYKSGKTASRRIKNRHILDISELPENFVFDIKILQLDGDDFAFGAFTSREKLMMVEEIPTITIDIESYLEKAWMTSNIAGIVINPWHLQFFLPNEFIEMIFEKNIPKLRYNEIKIITDDITKLDTMCIVNAANNTLLGGGGVDGAIHSAAGSELLLECQALGGCETGQAKITKGYNLKADHVIHTVGPVYSGDNNDAKMLRHCYWNSLELARENDIYSIAFPAISTGAYGYPVKEATEIALNTTFDWMDANYFYGMEITFVCFNDETVKVYNDTFKAIQKKREKTKYPPVIKYDGSLIKRAMQFAIECHGDDIRKGAERPYILHSMETMIILSRMKADSNLIAAGILYDTIGYNDTKLIDIYEQFGTDVAALVNMHTENNKMSWFKRKLYTVNLLYRISKRDMSLKLASELANLREIFSDYKLIGDEIWNRFNVPRESLAWYYRKLIVALSDMQADENTRYFFWELLDLFKELFVIYYVDEAKGILYEYSFDGSTRIFIKSNPQWLDFYDEIPDDTRPISLKAANNFEDNWNKPLWEAVAKDLKNGKYMFYSSDIRSFSIEIKDKRLTFFDNGYRLTKRNNKIKTDNMMTLYKADTARLLLELRQIYGVKMKLGTIFKKEYGNENGYMTFINFCEDNYIEGVLTSI